MPIAPEARVLITGAASGLGLALVRQFVERGGRVLATDVHEERPATLRGLDGVSYLSLDVTQDVDWAKARDWVIEEWDGLDYLFNNAGVAAGGRIELSEMDQWQWIIDINLLGVARGCRTFAPIMKEQGSGHIVNTASAAGLIHPPRMGEYNTVKAGVVALSETLFHELKPFGVRVSVACPTFFRTNLTDSLRGKDEAANASAAKLIDRAKLSADDIAARVVSGVARNRHIILTDRDGKMAYAAKRFARPLYYSMMNKASIKMSKKD
ncbi:SDR family NAD(P)-dependent oxidoreductase [Aeromicrobium sp.]|uniref:SDR family NAD(P)-dependent oxidoreductase n=1 Tax=Aeromicrobium sp. TaxID=1871063 RepID=UPI003C35CB34